MLARTSSRRGTTLPLRPQQACMGGRAPWALTGAHLMDRGVNPVVGLGEIAAFLFTQTRAGLSPCLSGEQPIRLLLSHRETASSYSVGEICCSFPLIISLSNTIVPFHVIFPSLLWMLYTHPVSSKSFLSMFTFPKLSSIGWQWHCALIMPMRHWSVLISIKTASWDEHFPWQHKHFCPLLRSLQPSH